MSKHKDGDIWTIKDGRRYTQIDGKAYRLAEREYRKQDGEIKKILFEINRELAEEFKEKVNNSGKFQKEIFTKFVEYYVEFGIEEIEKKLKNL